MSKIIFIFLFIIYLTASLTSAAAVDTSSDESEPFSIKEITFEVFKFLFNKTYEEAEELKRYTFKHSITLILENVN